MTYKGQETTPEFRFIKPVMESWTSLYEKTAEAYPQDDKYYIQELGGVALLCTASWMRGIPAVTEWPTKKQGSKWGHADILLGTGDMKIAGEAKIAWIYNRGSFSGFVVFSKPC